MFRDIFRATTKLPINPAPLDMRFIAGGGFTMGSDRHYPEEAPAHRVVVDDFWIDTTPVTNIEFEAFVADTGYETTAEQGLAPAPHQPAVDVGQGHRGSLVFERPGPDIDPRQWGTWWQKVEGADWRHPLGPDSNLDGHSEHPVVHVSYEDALAYAAWCHKSLPTEAEWEFAARGGLDGAEYAWGSMLSPRGRQMANIWQGAFPYENLVEDGFAGTSPVRSFPPNGYGIFDMIGNVWEWTTDPWVESEAMAEPPDCCAPVNPRLGLTTTSPAVSRVVKGGSHLCSRNLSPRYRPAARQPGLVTRTTNDIGFRCVYRR